MSYKKLNGKKVLEVGGTGAHSLLFSFNKAEMYATDISENRVESAKYWNVRKINTTFRLCDVENLPYQNNYFDIVYSNGVLHHTYDIKKAISEVYRVLKPGGEAIIMLYAKNSFLYFINIYLIKGIILGYKKKFKKIWIGASTEWMSSINKQFIIQLHMCFQKKK